MLSRKTSIVSYSRVYLQASWNFPLRERGLRFLRVFCMDTQDDLVRSSPPTTTFPCRLCHRSSVQKRVDFLASFPFNYSICIGAGTT